MDPYVTLGVPRTATEQDIRSAWKRLALTLHPDRNPGDPMAVPRFHTVAAAYELLSDARQRYLYDTTGSAVEVVIASKRSSYRVGRLISSGDVTEVSKAIDVRSGEEVAVKVTRTSANSGIVETEARVLRALWPCGAPESGHLRYLPRLIDSFRINSGSGPRAVNVFPLYGRWATLEAVRASYPGGVRFEHAVWMFNRLLEALDFLHVKHGMVHGAVTPSHVMPYRGRDDSDPNTHGLKLVGSAVPLGSLVRIVSPQWKGIYPPEIFRKREITASADIFLAARSIMYVLGGDPVSEAFPSSVPNYLAKFLRHCTAGGPLSRPGDAWTVHEELEEHMARHIGPKRYVPFDMPLPA